MSTVLKKPSTKTNLDILDKIQQHRNENQKRFMSSLWENYQEIAYYLKEFKLDNANVSLTYNYVNDALPRFLHTLELIPLRGNLEILELGANPYFFSILMRRLLPHYVSYANFFSENIYETRTDQIKQSIENKKKNEYYEFHSLIFNLEKTTPYPYKKETFDIVLCCEVLQHLILNPLNLFVEVGKILKPGGKLILTTTNAARLTNIATILSGRNIHDKYYETTYARQNREYTVAELKTIAINHDYKIEYIATRERFDYNFVPICASDYNGSSKLPFNKAKLHQLLIDQEQSLENRGDNIYLVAKKINY